MIASKALDLHNKVARTGGGKELLFAGMQVLCQLAGPSVNLLAPRYKVNLLVSLFCTLKP